MPSCVPLFFLEGDHVDILLQSFTKIRSLRIMQILKVRGHSAGDYHPCMVTLWSADFAALQGELDLGYFTVDLEYIIFCVGLGIV